jgi:hypothetical protein
MGARQWTRLPKVTGPRFPFYFELLGDRVPLPLWLRNENDRADRDRGALSVVVMFALSITMSAQAKVYGRRHHVQGLNEAA